MSSDRRHLASLTALRFLVALQVVVFHCGQPLLEGAPNWIRNIAAGGYVGVSFFFVLSGFILAYTHFDVGGRPRVSHREFWVARFARIYPVYVLGLLLDLPRFLRAEGALESGTQFVKAGGIAAMAATLTQAWSPSHACRVNCPGWSLSAEAFFYAIFPFVGIALCKLPRRVLPFAAGGLWLLALLGPATYLWLQPDGMAPVTPASSGFWISLLKTHPLLRLPEFVLGIVIGRWFVNSPLESRPFLPKIDWVIGLSLLGLLAMSDAVPYPLLHNGLLAMLIGLLILASAYGTGPLSRPLHTRGIRMMGEASYALYMLHVPVWEALRLLTADRVGPAALFLPYLALVLLISWSVFRFVETPGRRVLRDWLLRPRETDVLVR